MKHLKTLLLLDVAYDAGVVAGVSVLQEAKEPGSTKTHLLSGAIGQTPENYDALSDHCRELGLTAAAATARRMAAMVRTGKSPTIQDWLNIQHELQGRLKDELGERFLTFIEPDKVRFYVEPALFGPDVADAFPRAIKDIEDAGKCVALGLGTAAVFHLMRVMETGLQHLASRLGIPYAPSWESYIKQITARITAKHETKDVDWKRDESLYRDLMGDLEAVKIVWRNPTMHIVKSYEPEEARQVFEAVGRFMRDLSTKLSPANEGVK